MRFEFRQGYKGTQFGSAPGQGVSGVKVSIFGDSIGRLFGQGARAELHAEKLAIVNFVPYINILEGGKSPQAPQGILQDPEKAQHVRNILKKHILLLVRENWTPSQDELRNAMLKAAMEAVAWLRQEPPENPTPWRTGHAAAGEGTGEGEGWEVKK